MSNYICLIISDGFAVPESYGNQNCVSQDGLYKIIDKGDNTKAADIGYTPSANKTELYGVAIADWPNLTHEEALSLVSTVGVSGSSWQAPEIP